MRAPWDGIGNRSWFEQCRHGGGESSSASTQNTTNQDNRAAADTGSVAASGGASLSNVAVYNTSSDPAVITAALRSVENVAGGVAGAAIAAGVQQSAITAGTVNDLATAALHENRALSQDAIDQWAAVVDQALNTSATSIHDALNSLAGQSTSTSALASQALGEISPLQTTLKVVVYAIAAVAIVFFLSRSN